MDSVETGFTATKLEQQFLSEYIYALIIKSLTTLAICLFFISSLR